MSGRSVWCITYPHAQNIAWPVIETTANNGHAAWRKMWMQWEPGGDFEEFREQERRRGARARRWFLSEPTA